MLGFPCPEACYHNFFSILFKFPGNRQDFVIEIPINKGFGEIENEFYHDF
jgi:hypothetical protein